MPVSCHRAQHNWRVHWACTSVLFPYQALYPIENAVLGRHTTLSFFIEDTSQRWSSLESAFWKKTGIKIPEFVWRQQVKTSCKIVRFFFNLFSCQVTSLVYLHGMLALFHFLSFCVYQCVWACVVSPHFISQEVLLSAQTESTHCTSHREEISFLAQEDSLGATLGEEANSGSRPPGSHRGTFWRSIKQEKEFSRIAGSFQINPFSEVLWD
jgi:hypothetical protein